MTDDLTEDRSASPPDPTPRERLLAWFTRQARRSGGAGRYAPPTGGSRTGVRRTLLLVQVLTGVIVVAIIYGVVVSVLGDRGAAVPDTLVGLWRTTATGYADRALEIGGQRIVFHTGAGNEPQRYEILDVTRDGEGNAAWFTVSYGSRSDPQELRFYYNPSPQPRLTLQNRPEVIWTRE